MWNMSEKKNKQGLMTGAITHLVGGIASTVLLLRKMHGVVRRYCFPASFLLILILTLEGCGTRLISRAIKIDNGMHIDKVVMIMGRPEDKQFRNKLVAYTWCSYNDFGPSSYVVAFVTNHKVYAIRSYKNNANFGCTAGIRTIEWETPPDIIIEERQR